MPGSFDKSSQVQPKAKDIVQSEASVSSGNRDSLRAMGDLKTQQQALSPNTKGDPLVALFERIDQQKGSRKGIDKDEVKEYLKSIGVMGRMFSPAIRSKSAKAFIKELDKNKDKRVTYEEIQGIAAQLLPDEVFNSEGAVDPKLLDEYFKKADANEDGKVDSSELEQTILSAMPEGTEHASIKAWVASLIGVDALDSLDRDGTISRAELSAMAEQAARIKAGQ